MTDFKKTEEDVLKFWKQRKIYEKSRKKNAGGKKFYMMDGPPYATGHIHMGTALNKILKDIAMRSQRLQGKDVFDRAGYDTHGVPIEFQIEKEIGSKSKSDIEKYGVKKFIARCKEFATKHIGLMNSEFENLGVWMDFENPYLTLSNDYIEAIWDAFKIADAKGLLYLGKYPVHICPRCATAVAYNEIEYAKQEDVSVFVKFALKGRKNSFLIIWTTTPWTLPGNTGVMVHPDYVYQEIELANGERWIIAKELAAKIMKELGLGFHVKGEFKGKQMEGWQYESPLAKNLKLKTKNAYKVVLSARYVNLEEGTGLVHCAPGHGKEDYEVGKEAGLDAPSPVDANGLLTAETGKYAGKKARIVDSEIIADLEKMGALVHKVKYSHDYPFCWRCHSALLMVSQPQWFLKISEIHKKIMKENEGTNWIPSWMKLRMKAWLEGLNDWPVSRKRYWGTPLPIWVCEKCGERAVVGSIAELEKLSGKKIKEIHKPEIDEIVLKCKCHGAMKRVPEVLDVWFDSGVSSWAALDKAQFKKYWPADLNIEGKDQVRGWWNSQFILSEIKFDKKPFESISVHGMVLDLGKKKMSKSLGNAISPHEVIDKYSRDYMRYYFAKVSKGEDFAFDEKEFENIRKVLTFLFNVNNFIAQIQGKQQKSAKTASAEDKWLLSRLNTAVKEITESYNSCKFPEVVQKFEQLLVENLSKTYIKLVRDRAEEVLGLLNEARVILLKLLAPICPFITENIWQQLRKEKIVREESVHLSSLPKCDEKKIDKKLEAEFSRAFEIIEAGLAVRDKAQIGLKWPLALAEIKCKEKISKEVQEIIARQLNVKKIKMEKGEMLAVKLDTKMTPELEAEGYAREISRKVQAMRKEAGLVKENLIELAVVAPANLIKLLEKQKKLISDRTNAKTLEIASSKPARKFKHESKEKVKGAEISLLFNKV